MAPRSSFRLKCGLCDSWQSLETARNHIARAHYAKPRFRCGPCRQDFYTYANGPVKLHIKQWHLKMTKPAAVAALPQFKNWTNEEEKAFEKRFKDAFPEGTLLHLGR